MMKTKTKQKPTQKIKNNTTMIVSLTDSENDILNLYSTEQQSSSKTSSSSSSSSLKTCHIIGGKAASLQKLLSSPIPIISTYIPKGLVLTVAFFQPWMGIITSSNDYRLAKESIKAMPNVADDNTDAAAATTTSLRNACNNIKSKSQTLPLTNEQSSHLSRIREEMQSWNCQLAAVRLSAPYEDGDTSCFAGIFETMLGVTVDKLEHAVRDCFASVFDYRVFSYVMSLPNDNDDQLAVIERMGGFACVVMEMVDATSAGVAFSANPLNSDLDELVIDASWGLGESVVDGSVDPDHVVWDKLKGTIISQRLGSKKQERRLKRDGGGVMLLPVDEARQHQNVLSKEQIQEIANLVCSVEDLYGCPVDVEWAYTTTGSSSLELKLLQARPITTNYQLDSHLITPPSAPRILYYDYNICSDATTISPFTHMDLTLYSRLSTIMMGIPDVVLINDNHHALLFNSDTRQYCNLSYLFRYVPPAYFSEKSKLLDPYLADLFASNDCDRKKYKAKRKPKEWTIRNAFWLMRQMPLLSLSKTKKKYESDPEGCKEMYIKICNDCRETFKALERRGYKKEEGINNYIVELYDTLRPSLDVEIAVVLMLVVPFFGKLDAKRREGKTEEERKDYDALCKGYEGDEVMEKNKAMYQLANMLPKDIWDEYDHSGMSRLADKIENARRSRDDTTKTTNGNDDIPIDFLSAWDEFIETYGFDGHDQLFVSSSRYVDDPAMLLAKLRHNVCDTISDPAILQREQAQTRHDVMARQEAQAKNKWWPPFQYSKLKKRNKIINHLMWMRNAPKINLSRMTAATRAAVLKAEEELLERNMIDERGDVFHLSIDELDEALRGCHQTTTTNGSTDNNDIRQLIEPRKRNYIRAKSRTICPMLVDSRCRVLKPNPKTKGQPNEIIGTAISPGVGEGRVRIVHSPTDVFKRGEVLVAIVTDPAWTPLFVGASAVVLQVGGALQHGALCAREYGTPAVSGIEVMEIFKTGMRVRVDGNTGIVTILEKEEGGMC